MFKFDLKQGYHHIDISEEHQSYLGFSWNLEGKNRYFVYTVLPFGLTSAPFIFTKVMRVLIKFWRENLIMIAIFIDDGLGTNKDYEKTKKDSSFVKKSLKSSGFLENIEKSVWEPQQVIQWLGILANLEKMEFYIPQKRLISAEKLINDIITSLPYTSARKL